MKSREEQIAEIVRITEEMSDGDIMEMYYTSSRSVRALMREADVMPTDILPDDLDESLAETVVVFVLIGFVIIVPVVLYFMSR